ncbi:zinc-dependent peptidase [Mucilaginibacter rubeus]|uniref:Zinc-dependent peptidase n=1 Tax=Mucilaginibacter rubeus TaxID=2027860 RepID=A0AAE6JF39_9SPHI|nr:MULTISPECIES: M90 family metallopeptidase [Mucilaginibacter]QEM04148.1 zinc-dependent peptidase [Mucilaginibacter rubeus]QEM16750.1 zinc-dependent peptidase [Mucilaginibacter gossypii]QTE46772.1 zinc-dependent peptidase [Mucilaginibacter rubeus]QTE53369.1 zinc-dependent peptidase [Mucilaginibacter rubeus]QTE58455.1 zinc-dependent peptidase [Mucilaginibacter rubeus]
MVLILIVIVVALVVFVFLNKKKVVNETPAATLNYKALLELHIPYYQHLDADRKLLFERKVARLLADITIEGVGTTVSDADKVMIAASAVIPIFGFNDWKYRNLTNVILYPDTFDSEFQFEGENRSILGMVGSGYMNGQMILSRAALTKGFSKSAGKENTAIHEFVHLLDKADRATDGVPEILLAHEYIMPWLKMIHREIHKIEAGRSDINPYAITNEAEFLAVVAEYFFQKPNELKHKHPELYDMLSTIFLQDLADNDVT